jgi:nucleoside-diphosphate-sugar epimerase
MRVLVTGAAGFSGSQIAAHLARRGLDVVASYRHAPLPRWLEQLPRIESRRVHWLEREPGFSVDGIVHAAATSPAAGITDSQVKQDNVDATRAVLDFANRSGARRIVHLSSISVYGNILDRQVDENTPVRAPDIYGQAKLEAEALLRGQCEAAPENFAGLSIRLPGVVGPGAVRNWLATVAAKLRDDLEVPISNPNSPFNNAVHITDLAALAELVLVAKWTGFDTVTVGARGETTVRGAVERLAAGIGSRSRIVVEPSQRTSFTISSNRACVRHGYDPMEINNLLDRFAAETLQKR